MFNSKKEKKSFTIGEQMSYNMKRCKKGTKDRNGKPLSDFIRGKHLGKAKGMGQMISLHKKKPVLEAKNDVKRSEKRLSQLEQSKPTTEHGKQRLDIAIEEEKKSLLANRSKLKTAESELKESSKKKQLAIAYPTEKDYKRDSHMAKLREEQATLKGIAYYDLDTCRICHVPRDKCTC